MQRTAAHDVVPGKRHQHGVLDIVVECIAVTNALERDTRDRRHRLDQALMPGAETPTHVLAQEVA